MPTHYAGTDREVRALNTFIKLTRAVESLAARLAQRGSYDSLTSRQFGVLKSLYHLCPLRQGEICTRLLKNGGDITLVVDNLENATWYGGNALRTIAALSSPG